jgi:hypothetical protein
MNISDVAVNDVVTLHLTSGTTVVGRVQEKDGASLTLKDPVEIGLMQHPQNGQLVIGLQRWLTMGGKLPALPEVSIHFANIMTPRETPDQLMKDYVKATTGLDLSGQMPPAGFNGRQRQ